MTLLAEWIEAKETERRAVEKRRVIEDQLTAFIGLDEGFEGTKNVELDGYKVKAVARMTHKVDADKLHNLAIEHGLMGQIEKLFRAKYELNLGPWKNADLKVVGVLSEAVTTSPGRPSYSIEQIKE
jgi:hypothetical protein